MSNLTTRLVITYVHKYMHIVTNILYIDIYIRLYTLKVQKVFATEQLGTDKPLY